MALDVLGGQFVTAYRLPFGRGLLPALVAIFVEKVGYIFKTLHIQISLLVSAAELSSLVYVLLVFNNTTSPPDECAIKNKSLISQLKTYVVGTLLST